MNHPIFCLAAWVILATIVGAALGRLVAAPRGARRNFTAAFLVGTFLGVGLARLTVLGLAVAASGEAPSSSSTANHYDLDHQTAAWRSNRTLADSTAVATLTSTTTGRVGILGRRTVSVGGRFVSPGATMSVALLLLNGATVKGITDPQTLTAGPITDSAGRYMAPDRYFDTGGAEHGYVVITTGSSSGAADLWVGSN